MRSGIGFVSPTAFDYLYDLTHVWYTTQHCTSFHLFHGSVCYWTQQTAGKCNDDVILMCSAFSNEGEIFIQDLTVKCAKETNRPVTNVTNIVSDMMNGFFILCAVRWTRSFIVFGSVYRSITAEVLAHSLSLPGCETKRMCYRNGEFFIFGFDWIYIFISHIQQNFNVCCCSAHWKGNVAYVWFI